MTAEGTHGPQTSQHVATGALIIGDIHGELPALHALGRSLGYDVAKDDWPHPEGRRLVFVRDLVDSWADATRDGSRWHVTVRCSMRTCFAFEMPART